MLGRSGWMRRLSWVVSLSASTTCGGHSSDGGTGSDIPTLAFADPVVLGGMGAEGAAAFGTIRAVALLAGEGSFVVADGQTQALEVFSLTGDHLKHFSGRGAGPGEHQAIRSVWGASDGGICTWDIQTTRVTRFDANGGVTSTGRADLDGMETIRPSFQGFFDNCDFVLKDERFEMGMRDVPEGIRRDTVRFVLYRADGSASHALLVRPDAETWFRNRDQTWGHVSLVFGEELVGFTRGRELWVGISNQLRWTRIGLTGDTLGEVALGYQPRPATEQDIELERQRRVDEVAAAARQLPIGPPELQERIAESRSEGIRQVPAREHIPAYDVIVPGPNGALWIREYPGAADELATWFLLDSGNTRVGKMSIARNDSIVAGSATTVLVKSRDPMDAPLLRILRR